VISDTLHRDKTDLLVDDKRLGAVSFGEFAAIAAQVPVEVVHFHERLEELWSVPVFAAQGDVRVVDFLQKLDELGLPHTYRPVSEERQWWLAQDDAKIQALAGHFGDERSKQTLFSRVDAIRSGDRTPLLEVAFGAEHEYFNPANSRASLVPRPDDIFVDVGAAAGDTVDKYLCASGGRFAHIHAFEPTPGQYSELALREATPGITTYRNAVGAAAGKITFYDNPDNPFGSNAVAAGTGRAVEIDCVRLDDVVPRATLIKMDVEGYECNVIEGAKGMIAECQPDMAITCYHYPQDLAEILQKVEGIHRYRHVALRHFGPSLYDSVLLFSDRQRFDGRGAAH
jgi:FkbM family methyltransferase